MKVLAALLVLLAVQLPLLAQKQASMRSHVVLQAAELMPQPLDGYEAFERYLKENIRYPLEALEKRVEGYVFVRFVVREDGYLVEPVITQGLGHGCDEEVLRVIRQAAPWQPGKQGNQVVPVEMTLAILFRLPQ